MPTVLAILAEGFEEIELTAPVDVLRRAGITVTLAALGEGIHVTGRCGMTMHADASLDSLRDSEFDCVFIPGGPGVKHLRADPRVGALLVKQRQCDRWIAAICAAPLVLNDAGLLQGKRFTSHRSTEGELPLRLANEKVVKDGRLLTSRGAGTALEFGLSLVACLLTETKAMEIAESIGI